MQQYLANGVIGFLNLRRKELRAICDAIYYRIIHLVHLAAVGVKMSPGGVAQKALFSLSWIWKIPRGIHSVTNTSNAQLPSGHRFGPFHITTTQSTLQLDWYPYLICVKKLNRNHCSTVNRTSYVHASLRQADPLCFV